MKKKNYQYSFVYKCRLCGEEKEAAVTGSERLALTSLYTILRTGKDIDNGIPLYIFSNHMCANGDHGLADFQGYRKVEL